MARLKTDALKQVVIDNEPFQVPERSTIADVVPPSVTGITVLDDRSGRSHLVPRDRFNEAVPEAFTTHLTSIAKGAS